MKKAVYRLILFAAITAFVLCLSPSVKAEPNDTQTNQTQYIASDTKTLPNADKPEPAPHQKSAVSKENSQLQLAKEQLRGDFYKDSQDNLNSALNTLFTITIAVILSAFGVIAYFIFKDKRDYKDAVEAAKEAALSEGLKFIYIGNVPGSNAVHTLCPGCGKTLVERSGYRIN
ncbi:hypothetical protein LCGC14_2478010, partial [marine sediment metagenome]